MPVRLRNYKLLSGLFSLLCCLPMLHSCRVKGLSEYNTEARWLALHYNTGVKVPRADSAFLMVSNRRFLKDSLRFASEEIDTTQVHYLYIFKKGTRWEVLELKNLEAGIALMPARNWVLYTEGMGKLFPANIERGQLMLASYGVNVILFDYPSINSRYGGYRNYRFSRRNAGWSAPQYAKLLRDMRRIRSGEQIGEHSLSVFMHSMGNIPMKRVVQENLLYKDEGNLFVDNLIINAACVPRKNHGSWIDQLDFAKHLYVHYNKEDARLKGASLISLKKQLGNKPGPQLATRAFYVDFNEAVGKEHSYFLNIPGRPFRLSVPVQQYYRSILNGKFVDTKTAFPRAKKYGNRIPK